MTDNLTRIPTWAVIISILSGIYFFYEGLEAWRDEQWPRHLGPSLNVFADIFVAFGSPTDAYIGGSILMSLGLFIIGFVLYLKFKKNP